MIDILVLSTPVDATRAGVLVDALVSTGVAGPYRTRLLAVSPEDDEAWAEVEVAAQSCRCVIFCWSTATTTREATRMRTLASSVFGDGRAISVELDARTRPKALKGCTTYPLYGWRSNPRWWHTFVFGSRFVTQIAAGAKEKVIGRDPPPPSAYARMVRAQAWAVLVGGAALIGVADNVLGLFDRAISAKWLHPEIGAAFNVATADPKPCEAVRRFATRYPGSAWTSDVSERLATCTLRSVTVIVDKEEELPVFGVDSADVQRDGREKCLGRAKLTGAELTSMRIKDFVANVRATAVCSLKEPTLQTVETMGSASK